ncbi:uncharacterized protein [Eucyclogobius newberryi]|uniref:uncharacterized protein n=1 Tax=Eucyclogobius newberryi TaxID=166745 RepID=UPI003B5A34E5
MWVSNLIFFIFCRLNTFVSFCSDLCAGCAGQEEALPVPRVHLESQWSEVFPSEQVKLQCDINGGDWTIAWYRDEQSVTSADASVILESRSLTLLSASQSQSGKYSCEGLSKTNASVSTTRSPATQITVHGEKLKPKLSIAGNLQSIFVGESFAISCSISASSSWEYVWYLNDNLKVKSSDNVYTVASAEEAHNGNYYCRVRRGLVTVSSDSNTINVKVAGMFCFLPYLLFGTQGWDF